MNKKIFILLSFILVFLFVSCNSDAGSLSNEDSSNTHSTGELSENSSDEPSKNAESSESSYNEINSSDFSDEENESSKSYVWSDDLPEIKGVFINLDKYLNANDYQGRKKIEFINSSSDYSVNYIIYSTSEILYDFKICRIEYGFDENDKTYYYCRETIFNQETLSTDFYIKYKTNFVGSSFQEAIIFKDETGNVFTYGLNSDDRGEENIYTFWANIIYDN